MKNRKVLNTLIAIGTLAIQTGCGSSPTAATGASPAPAAPHTAPATAAPAAIPAGSGVGTAGCVPLQLNKQIWFTGSTANNGNQNARIAVAATGPAVTGQQQYTSYSLQSYINSTATFTASTMGTTLKMDTNGNAIITPGAQLIQQIANIPVFTQGCISAIDYSLSPYYTGTINNYVDFYFSVPAGTGQIAGQAPVPAGLSSQSLTVYF